MLRKKLLDNEKQGNNNKTFKTDYVDDGLLDLSLGNCCPSDVSKYFPSLSNKEQPPMPIQQKILQFQIELNNKLRTLDLKTPPIEYVYNPVEYACVPNEMYISKYCTTTKKLLFVGMNPGPFGMCQTGVPFGDPKWVRNWLQIEGVVFKPAIECPQRKILGFSSPRREQSGERFWRFFSELCKVPENFFKHAFLCNFCPLALMKGNGCNVTPAEIKDIKLRRDVEVACDDWYLKLIATLQPEIIVAIGTYIEKRTKDLFKNHGINHIQTLYMPHPSPRAINNHNWHEKAAKVLTQHNLDSYFRN